MFCAEITVQEGILSFRMIPSTSRSIRDHIVLLFFCCFFNFFFFGGGGGVMDHTISESWSTIWIIQYDTAPDTRVDIRLIKLI